MKQLSFWVHLLAAAVVATAVGMLTGCERSAGNTQPGTPASQFKSTDITGIDYAKDFALTDHTGKARTLADFKGKAVFIFFGYTQCPDVCPATMAEMAQVMTKLGPKADQLQVLFVTLDPERDTPALLAQYVPAFDARFLGLYGSKEATEKTARDFKVFYQKAPGNSGNGYTIDHSTGSYVFDPQGRLRLYVRHGMPADDIAHDIALLLK